MHDVEIYISLVAIIIIVGILFTKSPIPSALLLVITGMVVSVIPGIPHIKLRPDIVLDLFLPLLIYQTCVLSSWRDFKKDFRAITLLSVGHVLFITLLVAVCAHQIIPELSWPMSFVLGAVISPPDDIAIIAIAEKIRMPQRIVTILKGEGIFNDATALILFRFSLAAVITHQFFLGKAFLAFALIVIGESLYGFILGNVIAKLRTKLNDPILHMLISVLTPFLAYLPAERLGGSGVLATVVTGLVVEHHYSRYLPEVRLLTSAVWKTLGFTIESILFLLVGLNLHYIYQRITTIPIHQLVYYSVSIILIVIVGRFIWVFPASYLPRYFFPSIRKRDPYPPWQYPFITAWAGMRGGISLAAALAIPILPTINGVASERDLLVFLVFMVIIATLLVQGLALPWLLDVLGINSFGAKELHTEYLEELSARLIMTNEVIRWLNEYQDKKPSAALDEEIKFRIADYKNLKKRLTDRIKKNSTYINIIPDDITESIALSRQILDIERNTLLNLWKADKINHSIRNKLQEELDHRSNQFVSI